MTETKSNLHTLVEKLQSALTCPGCDYSLHGLVGDVVRCPECGLDIDVAKLIANRWTGKWYNAPGFNRGLLPLVWSVVVVTAILAWQSQSQPWLTFAAIIAALLAGWALFLWLFARRVGWPASIWHAALGHIAFGGYIVGIWIVLGGLIRTIQAFTIWNGPIIATALAWTLLGVGLFIAARMAERHIARICIRRYLRDAASPTAGALQSDHGSAGSIR